VATFQARPSRSAPPDIPALCPPLQPAAPKKALPKLWKVAAWEIEYLESCHLGNCDLGSRPCRGKSL